MTYKTEWQRKAKILSLAFALPWIAGQAFAEEPIKISVVGAFTANEWHTEIKAGAEQAVRDLGFPVGLRVIGPSDFDPVKQAEIFTREAQTKPDGMIVVDVAAALFVEPVQEAQKQGIVVSWENSAPSAEFAGDLFVSADPKDQGLVASKIIAQELASKLGKSASDIEGTVVVGLCVPGLSVLENRIGGFRKGITQVMPKVSVLPTVLTKPDRSGNLVSWNQAIQANPGALAYLDACEAGQQNIAKIIEDDKLDAISVALDSPSEVLDAVARGVIPAAAASNHYLQAYMATYLTAKSIHDHTPLPKGWVVIPTVVIDSSNIDTLLDAWKDPSPGLRAYFDADVKAVEANIAAGKLSAIADYDKPAQ